MPNWSDRMFDGFSLFMNEGRRGAWMRPNSSLCWIAALAAAWGCSSSSADTVPPAPIGVAADGAGREAAGQAATADGGKGSAPCVDGPSLQLGARAGGHFTREIAPSAPYNSLMRVADLSGDGHPDFVNGGVVFENDGRGGFSSHQWEIPIPPEWNVPTTNVYRAGDGIVDIDADGDQDITQLISLRSQGRAGASMLGVWLNDGTGHFQSPSITNLPPNDLATHSSTYNALQDLDGNGSYELIVPTALDGKGFATAFTVYQGDGHGSFVMNEGSPLDAPVTPNQSITFVDWNGDKLPDILANDRYGNPITLKNVGGQSFRQVGTSPIFGMPADVDNDGILDLVGGTPGGSSCTEVAFGDGTGSFIRTMDLPCVLGTPMGPPETFCDGRMDFLSGLARPSGGYDLGVTSGPIRGQFSARAPLPPSIVTSASESLFVADFDGDGVVDFLTIDDGLPTRGIGYRVVFGAATVPPTSP